MHPSYWSNNFAKLCHTNDNFWHIDACENIPSPACLTVFVKSKTENQLIRFVIAYIVADNTVKCETVAATQDPRLHHSRLMASCNNSSDLWITGHVEYWVTCLSEIC